MEFAGVYHKTSEQMSYPCNERELIINLKTGYDVKRVFLHQEIHSKPEFLAAMKNGLEKGKKSVIKSA